MAQGDDAATADDAADKAVEAREDALRARDQAEDARGDAEKARADAERETGDAKNAGDGAATENPIVHELLIHPDDEPDFESANPFGEPGPPISKRSPFYIGFVGAMGALSALVIGLAIVKISSVLIMVLIAAFLAIGLNPIVEWLMHRGLRRPWAVFVVSLGVLGVVAIFLIALVPVLRDQITALINNVPTWLDELQKNKTIHDLDQKYDIISQVNDKVTSSGFAQKAFGSVFSVGLAVVNTLLNAFLIFVLTLYFLAALPTIKRACYSLAPASRRTRVTYLGDEILRRVGGYVSGAFVIALCAGTSSFIFLSIVGLGKYAVALALVVAILDFIPLIGATIGAAIVTVIGFATAPVTGIVCIIFFVVYQQVENYVIYPRVMRSSVNVPGFLTVIAVLIGGTLIGPVGALLAIPTVAAVMLITREVFVRRQDLA